MKTTDNKGYSLVELIVAFALLAIVSAILLGFVSTGGRLYNSVSSEVGLQMSTQISLSQIKDYILDCNEGICFEETSADSSAMYIITSSSSGTGKEYTLHTFRFDRDSGNLYYGNSPITLSAEGEASYNTEASDLMADDLTEFLLESNNIAGLPSGAVKLTADFQSRSKTYDITQTISLRNKPYFSFSLGDLIALVF